MSDAHYPDDFRPAVNRPELRRIHKAYDGLWIDVRAGLTDEGNAIQSRVIAYQQERMAERARALEKGEPQGMLQDEQWRGSNYAFTAQMCWATNIAHSLVNGQPITADPRQPAFWREMPDDIMAAVKAFYKHNLDAVEKRATGELFTVVPGLSSTG